MSDEQVRLHFQVIRQRIAALRKKTAAEWEDIDAALEDLYVLYEELQTSLEAASVVEEGILQQNQQLAEQYHYYYDLFQSAPIAYLVIDENGLILDANQAIAQLLHVPQRYLVGKPLSVYVAEHDRPNFRARLNQLSRSSSLQAWQMTFCPRENPPFAVELHVAPVRSATGLIEYLQVGIYTPRPITPPPHSLIPQSLDGLRVLVVDDEPDVCEFITATLESQGIGVRAVTSVAAALEELERFRPDVLVSDIRMPGRDGYDLIRQIRTLEAEQGKHIPAAAITAYLEEDREKALDAGFEMHLHKLAQPIELVEMVAQLAGRL